jgi:hypothetical protein
MKKARKCSDKDEHIPNKKGNKVYVPIVVCIKTKNVNTKQAERILESLISILLKDGGCYSSELHNKTFSYAEFCYHILILTSLIGPTPLTQFSISMGNKSIDFFESHFADFPGAMDTSIAQLFSILRVDLIITLWNALLLEQRVVIYSNDPNYYFFIMKALNQLLFPFTWAFSKGVVPTLDILTTPFPFCFGIIIAKNSQKIGVNTASFPIKEILVKLEDENLKSLLLEIENCKM